MAINTQKLLPSSKGGALVKFNAGRISSSLSIQKKSIDVNKLALLSQKRNEQNVSIIQKSLVNVDTLLKSILTEDQQTERTKKQIRDQEEAEKRETKLETPKEAKKFKLPGVSLPGMGFLDRIKRFLFFTALGWLFNRFQNELPRLVGIVKVIMPIYGVVENIFKFILESTVNFIDRAYETYDKFRGLVKTIGGENAETEFDKLSGKLNEYINYVLIGGMALTGAINTFAQNARNYKPPKPPLPKPPTPRGPVQGVLRTAQAAAIRASRAVIGKQATKQILRTIKGPLSRIPLVGGLIEFGLSWALGDSPGKAAFRGVGSTLLGGVGMAIGAFPPLLPFGGPLIGSFLGGWAGAELGGLLYDVLFQNKKPSAPAQPVQKERGGGRVIRRYAKGGQVIGQGGRTLTIQGNKNKFAAAQTTQPGKDVGGKKKIRKLYPDPSYKMSIAEWNLAGAAGTYSDYEKEWEKQKDKPNPYQALTEIADIFKQIPYGVGGLMGGAVDAALGQKISESTLLSINSGLESLFETFSSATNNIKSGVSQGILGVQEQISTMQSGGAIPRTSGLKAQSKDIDPIKVIGTSIKQKVNNALREVQNQIAISTKKKATTSPGKTLPGTTPPSTPGAQPPPTGKNGRYTKAELTYVGKMSPAEPKVKFDNDWYGRDIYLRPAAAVAFKAAQKEAGPKIGWILNSGYRSLEHQQALIDAGYPAAPLGTSNHGDGIALDVQEGTNGHSWLVRNGAKFGWRWPQIKGDLVHFYYDGSYVPKGQKPPLPDIFKPEPKQQPGQLPNIFQLPGQQPTPQPKPTGKVYKGTASWYGRKDGFHGKPTSSGEIFNTDKLTAAIQWDLRNEFGGVTNKSQLYYAKVTNLDNGKSVTVKINDVGPLSSGGVIDLSEAAFKSISSGGLGQGRLYNVTVQKMGSAPRESSKQASISGETQNQFANLKPNIFDAGPYSNTTDSNLIINPNILMGLENAAKNIAQNYQMENILDANSVNNTQQYIPKQSYTKNVSSLTSYPTYSYEGMIAIQPVIIEKQIPMPIPTGGNKSTTFFVSGGVNNSNMQSLSRG